MIDKQLLQKRFNHGASTYDQYANVQKQMAHRLMEQLKTWERKPSGSLHILEAGCGTGYLTMLLRQAFPDAEITAVDLAPGMLETTRKRLGDGKVTLLCGDIEEMCLHTEYDLIVSNATFQWFNSIADTVNRLGNSLKEEGKLWFSTFGDGTFKELHDSYKQAAASLGLNSIVGPGQSFYSLHELLRLCDEGLNGDGLPRFSITGHEQEVHEYFDSVRNFFTSIKKIGAANSNEGRYCQRPSLFRELVKVYEENYKHNQLIQVTYHCMYFNINKNNSGG